MAVFYQFRPYRPFGDAIIVSPLSNLHPIFVVVLSYFFLGRAERLTTGIVVGVCVVVTRVLADHDGADLVS